MIFLLINDFWCWYCVFSAKQRLLVFSDCLLLQSCELLHFHRAGDPWGYIFTISTIDNTEYCWILIFPGKVINYKLILSRIVSTSSCAWSLNIPPVWFFSLLFQRIQNAESRMQKAWAQTPVSLFSSYFFLFTIVSLTTCIIMHWFLVCLRVCD